MCRDRVPKVKNRRGRNVTRMLLAAEQMLRSFLRREFLKRKGRDTNGWICQLVIQDVTHTFREIAENNGRKNVGSMKVKLT